LYDSETFAVKFAITKSPLPIATDINFHYFCTVKVEMLNEGFKRVSI